MFIANCKTLLLSMTNIALDKEKIDDSHFKKIVKFTPIQLISRVLMRLIKKKTLKCV